MHHFSTSGFIVLGIIFAIASWGVIEFVLWLLNFIHVSIC